MIITRKALQSDFGRATVHPLGVSLNATRIEGSTLTRSTHSKLRRSPEKSPVPHSLWSTLVIVPNFSHLRMEIFVFRLPGVAPGQLYYMNSTHCSEETSKVLAVSDGDIIRSRDVPF